MKKNQLEIIVFFCGAVIMILELVGSRILAPYVGTSLYVWSALMGVILGALSVGYYSGGRLADKDPKLASLAKILLIASVNIAVVGFLKKFVAQASATEGVAWGSMIACLILFAPPSVLLGMVSPYAIKLKLKKIENSGNVAGSLYAFSTVGSIVGTFLAGFVLIPNFNITNIVFGLSILLLIISLFCNKKSFVSNIPYILIIIFFWPLGLLSEKDNNYLVNANTPYSFIQVRQYTEEDGRIARELKLNREKSSAIYINSEDLVYEYAKYYRLDQILNSNINKALLLGGGAGSVVTDYLNRNDSGTIDVVELDPKVTEVAREYFGLEENERVKYYHEDGRIYINNTNEKYDAVYIDVFRSRFYVPWHLTTQESFLEVDRILNDNGVVIMNINTSVLGEDSRFLWAEYKTLKTIFPYVFVFSLQPNNYTGIQNVMLVATKKQDFNFSQNYRSDQIEMMQNYYEVKEENTKNAVLLTDDFAPVDYYALSKIDL